MGVSRRGRGLVMREFHAMTRSLGFILQAMGNPWNISDGIVT